MFWEVAKATKNAQLLKMDAGTVCSRQPPANKKELFTYVLPNLSYVATDFLVAACQGDLIRLLKRTIHEHETGDTHSVASACQGDLRNKLNTNVLN